MTADGYIEIELFSDDDTPEVREAKIRWAKEFPERVKLMRSILELDPMSDVPTPPCLGDE
jgi:hypothetical protein